MSGKGFGCHRLFGFLVLMLLASIIGSLSVRLNLLNQKMAVWVLGTFEGVLSPWQWCIRSFISQICHFTVPVPCTTFCGRELHAGAVYLLMLVSGADFKLSGGILVYFEIVIEVTGRVKF